MLHHFRGDNQGVLLHAELILDDDGAASRGLILRICWVLSLRSGLLASDADWPEKAAMYLLTLLRSTPISAESQTPPP